MRLTKYYDALRTNIPFFKTSSKQKAKILLNILKFFMDKGKIIIRNKPVIAQIEPTSMCNLKCEMCIRDKIGVPIGSMNFENFKKILRKLDCLFKISLSGQGEPLLNKNLFRMIKYANQKGILVNTSTNATLLNEEAIQKICEVDIGEITISMESPEAKNYEKIRKGAKFEEVMKNTKNLTRKLKEENKKTIVSLAITILKENIEDLSKFVDLAERVGIKKVVFQTMQNKEDYVSRYSAETRKQAVFDLAGKIKEKMEEAIKTAKEKGITLIFDEGKNSPGCVWPWRSIYISWDGHATACCKILDYRSPYLGNILKEDLWKVWNGEEYQKFRKLLKNRQTPFPCRGCNMV